MQHGDQTATSKRIALRLVHGGRHVAPKTGEQVLREGARMLGAYLMRQLAALPQDDPDYDVIAADASRFAHLGGLRSPQTPHESRA